MFDGLLNQRLYLFGVSYVGVYEANIQAGLPQLLLNSLSAFSPARGDATLAPASAKSFAAALPIPALPPVIRATFPSSAAAT
jgi:hypothetical protein